MHRNVCLLLLIAVAGCSSDYPFDKPGTWRIGDAPLNDANLRAMLVDQHDLVEGRGTTVALGAEAAPPVRRLFNGQRFDLPSSNAALLTSTSAPQQQATQGADNVGQ